MRKALCELGIRLRTAFDCSLRADHYSCICGFCCVGDVTGKPAVIAAGADRAAVLAILVLARQVRPIT